MDQGLSSLRTCPARFRAGQSYLVGVNSPQATIGHAHFFVGLSFAVVGWAIVIAAYRIAIA